MKYEPAAIAMLVSSMVMCVAHGAAPESRHVPGFVQSAVNDPTRPQADRQRDVNRKAAEVLAFAGVKPGDKVLELLGAPGYYTRLLCRVVGASGHVYAEELKAKPPENPASQPSVATISLGTPPWRRRRSFQPMSMWFGLQRTITT